MPRHAIVRRNPESQKKVKEIADEKSVAIHLVFQAPDRTLTDEDAAAARGRIVEALRQRFGAELRA